jgi:hypothetical protein
VIATMSFTPASAASRIASAVVHRRHVDDRRIRAGRCDRVGDGVEDRHRALELLAAFPGVTPATTFVPYSIICLAWNEPSRP